MTRRRPTLFAMTMALLALGASACTLPFSPSETPTPSATATLKPTTTPTATNSPTRTPSPTPTATLTPTVPPSGPAFKPGTNPLTGLPMADPGAYRQAPLLVSITNFPPSSRPQAGLSQADHVWETSIGQGLTRFLAVYYGDYPARLAALAAANPPPRQHVMAPIRSGRVAFDDIRAFYPGGLLVTRAASPEVLPQLGNRISVYALDPENVNSAGLTVDELHELPLEAAQPADYAGLRFDPHPPAGGQTAPDLSMIYNYYAQFSWSYDSASARYIRSQDPADGSGDQSPQLDRLTDEPLVFENVVVIFADDKFENPAGTILEIDLRNLENRSGLLFRDGLVYEIHWSTIRDKLRLLDESGNDFPLKPGRIFFELVNFRTTWDSDKRVLRYHSPPLPTPTDTPTVTPTDSLTPEPSETPSPGPAASPTPEPATFTPTASQTPQASDTPSDSP